MHKEIVYKIYQVNHYHYIKTIHISNYINILILAPQSPLKAKNRVYIGMPMGYGTIASNGVAHGYKSQNQK